MSLLQRLSASHNSTVKSADANCLMVAGGCTGLVCQYIQPTTPNTIDDTRLLASNNRLTTVTCSFTCLWHVYMPYVLVDTDAPCHIMPIIIPMQKSLLARSLIVDNQGCCTRLTRIRIKVNAHPIIICQICD